ncbi:hypothetical protein AMATHDRAFT_150363 [Amanita thiersii Skay4041]|uniref:CENP-V/GFA domain-containing protein n=1 Tax=Amanita thiersii Skay4041 TaxID=703135 RepID=A0A2A9NKL0_9AGAR|nr:hypothetical protein AMATHDRAFT_150363 [Amanita thiersii Skay4041]
MGHKGACLCGQTTIEIAETFTEQLACHCKDCRQTSGSAFATNVIVPKSQLKITGPIKQYKNLVPTGNYVTRTFCGNCGSAISHGSDYFGETVAVQTGNFEDFANIPFTTEIFVKDRWPVLAEMKGTQQVDTQL